MGLSGGLASNGTQGSGSGSGGGGTAGLAINSPRYTALQVLGGVPVSPRSQIFTSQVASNGTDTGQNSKTAHKLTAATSFVRLVFANFADFAGVNADPAIPILVKASVEISGTLYPAWFRGTRQPTIDAGGVIVSDPIAIGNRAKGLVIFVRSFVSTVGGSTASGAWPQPVFTASAQSEGAVNTTTGVAPSDLTTTSTITASASHAFGPFAVLGATETTAPTGTVAGFGDSIMAGTSDNGPAGDFFTFGFLARALNQTFGYLNLGKNGDTFPSVAVPSSTTDRRLAYAAGFSNVCINYGTNDIMGGSTTFFTTVTSAIAAWQLFSDLGCRVFQTTCTPRTTTTDAWATTTNQTPAVVNVNAGEPARQTWNAWLRAGAPITAGAAKTGTATYSSASNQVTLSAAGTWSGGDVICGIGIPAGTTIVSGAGTTTLTISAQATVAATTAPVLGGSVIAAAATHPLYAAWDIAATIESTQAGVAGAGGNVWRVSAATADGIHPGPAGHALMAANVTTAQLATS